MTILVYQKAFSATGDKSAQGSDEAFKICNSQRRLSENERFLTNPLWVRKSQDGLISVFIKIGSDSENTG
jgi:hypothetical protein